MGKIGEEITQKIKSAVKAKLIELGIEVDNELPDYIMVLVANKKTQPQMEKDLQLFLGPHTVLFTSWLLNVLKKLEEVTVSKKNYKKIEVTNQEGSLVVTKKEDDFDKRKPVRVKIEPGTAETGAQEMTVSEEPSVDQADENRQSSDEQSSDEDEQYKSLVDENTSQIHNSPSKNLENSVSNDEDSSHGELSFSHNDDPSGRLSVGSAEDHSESNDDSASKPQNIEDNSNKKPSDSHRPKIIYGIREQIDEVMEKTISENRRPREDRERTSVDSDHNRRKSYDHDEHDDSRDSRRSSTENDFYKDQRSSTDNRLKSLVDSRRSPDKRDRFRDTRRSPDFRKRSPISRRRVTEFGRRSPDARRRSPYARRRSPDDRRRSPMGRRRSPDDRRRSPDDRRRSPIERRRSPIDRRRSPVERRRSPIDRRRSPIDRRRSPIDRRRNFDDGGKKDVRRSSPDSGSKPRMMDAREILKRKNNSRNENVSPDHSYNDGKVDKRRKTIPSLVHKPEEPRDRSVEPQIPSLVRVTPRPIRKEAIQPNKKLLLLAVADAEKSISKPHNKRLERHSPPPSSSRKRDLPRSEKLEIRKTVENEYSKLGYVPPEKIFVTLTNNQMKPRDDGIFTSSREVTAKKLYEDVDLTLDDELNYEDAYFDYDEMTADEIYAAEHKDEYVPLPVKEKAIPSSRKPLSMLMRRSEGKCIISLESSPERSCDEWEEMVAHRGNEAKLQMMCDNRIEKNPSHDIMVYSTSERTDEGIDWNRLGPAPVAAVKPLALCTNNNEKFKGEGVHKALERCKYWPACLSETCIYFHPNKPCQMFPLCKSGKDCLFIHPDCKFGFACLNTKCTFLHQPPTEFKKVVKDIEAVSILPEMKTSPQLIKCVYFPNCKNLNCKFWHPVKNCKYGRTCARSDCYFFHPTLVIPPKDLLTWTPTKI